MSFNIIIYSCFTTLPSDVFDLSDCFNVVRVITSFHYFNVLLQISITVDYSRQCLIKFMCITTWATVNIRSISIRKVKYNVCDTI